MTGSQHRDGPGEWTLGERYRVGREIGRGSYGVVHRAIDLQSGQEIALKLVDLERDGGPEDAATERSGAALQQRFGRVHPGFVPEVFEHGEINGYYAIAMELIEAPSLSQTLVRNGPLADRRAAEVALAIAGFLDRARRFNTAPLAESAGSQPIVHGDLKPQHVKLLADGTIRVLDFGIAHGLSTSRTSATARGTSTHYASPELLETGRVRPQEDWWALGIMLFEMLAGVVPYHRYTLQSSLERAIRTGAPRDALPPSTHFVLAAIVEKLLHPQPERRYPSAAAIARDLTAFLDGEPTVAGSEAATAETVRWPIGTGSRPPAAAFDVPTLPVTAPTEPRKTASGAPSGAASHVASAIPGRAAADAPAARVPPMAPAAPATGKPAARRRIWLIVGIPLGIAILNNMCDGRPEPFAPRIGVGSNTPPVASPAGDRDADAVARRPGADRVASRLDMEFVRIRPGEFTMGCSQGDQSCNEDEFPPHPVRIARGFQLGKYEVTVQQWATILLEGAVDHADGRFPVSAIWADVQEFLDRLNERDDGYIYRLPTEAEWEYAARAGTTGAHGGDLDDMAWHATGRMHEVGVKKPNQWGLHDMLGNAGEWVQDWYGPYRQAGVIDPTGPESSDHRVVRGGDSFAGDSGVRVSARSYALPSASRGFRVVRERAPEREEG
jgi:formylglycine-generating enzyme required for sulfatase activity